MDIFTPGRNLWENPILVGHQVYDYKQFSAHDCPESRSGLPQWFGNISSTPFFSKLARPLAE